jgi:hypothetical protein
LGAKRAQSAKEFLVTQGIAPERHVLFAYTAKHDGAAVDRLLEGYEGYLVADAHAVFDHLYRRGTVIEVGCWAHARRYWWKALDTDPERARQALAFIGGLFRVERATASAPPEERLAARRAESKPILDGFFAWCDTAIANMRVGMKKGIVLPAVLVERMLPQYDAMVVDDVTRSIFFEPIRNMPAGIAEADKQRLEKLYRDAIRDKVVASYRKMGAFVRDEYLPAGRQTAGSVFAWSPP